MASSDRSRTVRRGDELLAEIATLDPLAEDVAASLTSKVRELGKIAREIDELWREELEDDADAAGEFLQKDSAWDDELDALRVSVIDDFEAYSADGPRVARGEDVDAETLRDWFNSQIGAITVKWENLNLWVDLDEPNNSGAISPTDSYGPPPLRIKLTSVSPFMRFTPESAADIGTGYGVDDDGYRVEFIDDFRSLTFLGGQLGGPDPVYVDLHAWQVKERTAPTKNRASDASPIAPAAPASTTNSPKGKWRGRLADSGSFGIASIVFVVVVLVTAPVAWIGLGIAAGIAYLGNPLMERFWHGPWGLIAQAGGTAFAALIVASIAATAVRSSTRRDR